MKKTRSLALTFVLSFLALAGGVILITAPLNIYSNFQNQRNVVNGQQQLIAQSAATTVRNFIQEKFNILDAAGKLADPIFVSQEKQRAVLERLLGLELSFRQIILLDGGKKEVASASRLSKEASSSLLSQVKAEELFSRVEKGGEYISSVYIDEVSSEPMVVIAVPVKNIFGDFQGTLVAELNLKFMWDLVAEIKVGASGQAYVVDKYGSLLAFHDISRVLKGENVSFLREVGSIQINRAVITKGIEGKTVLSTYVQLDFPDWTVVVESPILEAYSSVVQTVGISIIAIVLILVVTVAMGFYLSRKIVKPIISLRDAAVQLSQGKLTTRIETQSQDEIGELAQAFNQMASQLQQSYQVLEQKVADRTQELNVKLLEFEKINKLMIGRELKMIELKKEITALKSGKLSSEGKKST